MHRETIGVPPRGTWVALFLRDARGMKSFARCSAALLLPADLRLSRFQKSCRTRKLRVIGPKVEDQPNSYRGSSALRPVN